MALRNDTQVAGQLVNLPSAGTGPLAHLVLSGHTHRLYPAHSKLPPNAGALRHPPLGLHQLQLVVGSLSKAVRDTTKPTPDQSYDVNGETHQCQVLRFFPISGHSHSLVVKRLLIGRNNGTGQFKFIEVSSNPTEYWEETYLNF